MKLFSKLPIKLSTPIKQAMLYAISVALMRGISLLMLPFLANFLSPEEFGRLELLSSIAIVGSVLVGLGLEDALFRFVGQSDNDDERKRIAGSIFTLTIIIGGVFALLHYPLATLLATFIPGELSLYAIQLVLMILALEGVISVPLGWLRMRDKAALFCVVSVGRVFIQAGLTFWFLSDGKGVEGVFEAGFIAVCIQALTLSWLQLRDTGLRLCKNQCKSILFYSVPLVVSGLLAFGLNGFDRWVIATTVGIDQVALYGIAAKFSIAITILMQPYGMWWMPRRFSELTKADGINNVLRYSVLGLVMIILLMLIVGLLAPWLIVFMLPAEYSTAGIYVVGLISIVALKEATEFINIGCFKNDSTKIQLWINIATTFIGCIMLLIGAELYAVWGIIGALFIAYSLRLSLFFYYSQRVVFIDYPIKKLVLLFSIASLMLVLTLQYSTLSTGELLEIKLLSVDILLVILVFIVLLLMLIHTVIELLLPLFSQQDMHNDSRSANTFKKRWPLFNGS